jgi:hypothetical protein
MRLSRGTILDISFVLLLVALPLISLGTINENPSLWVLGVVLLLAGFGIPLLLRFLPVQNPPEEEPDVFEEPS